MRRSMAYLERAEEMRVAAECMTQDETRDICLRCADSYELMAETARKTESAETAVQRPR